MQHYEQSQPSSFHNLSEEEVFTHLCIKRYGNFMLTEAVRPAYDLQVVPEEGYMLGRYTDPSISIPVIQVAVSAERLFDVFMGLVAALAGEPAEADRADQQNNNKQQPWADLEVILESSHQGHEVCRCGTHESIVLRSRLWDYKELLLNDGCAGIALVRPGTGLELFFDEHKLLIIYSREIRRLAIFEAVLAESGIGQKEGIAFITEAEHVHFSNEEYRAQFNQFKVDLEESGW